MVGMAAAPQLEHAFDTVVMKFGGSSVADAEKVKPSRGGSSRPRSGGLRVVGTVSAMGKTTDALIALAHEVSPDAEPARARHAALDRRAHLVRARGDGDPRPRPRGRLADRLAGRHPDRLVAHQGEDRRDPRRTASSAALDAGKIVLVAGFQGVSPETKDVTTLGRGGTDATAVALAAALGAACEIYSDVPGRVHRRPAHRPRRPQARGHLLRGDARDVGVRREGADAAVGRARPKPRRARARPLDVLGRARAPGSEEDGMEKPIISARHAQRDEVVFTLTGIPDRPGAAAARLRRRRRRARERRHDHPERRARRRRAVVLGAARGRRARRARAIAHARGDARPDGGRGGPRSARSR